MKAVIEGLKKAISLAPQSAYALYSLATAYHRLAGMSQSEQILGEAINTFNKAYGKFPEYGDGLVLYAMVSCDLTGFYMCHFKFEITRTCIYPARVGLCDRC